MGDAPSKKVDLLTRPDIDTVAQFWNQNPLFVGESKHPSGTKAYFEEHRQVVIDDTLAGAFDLRTLPPPENRDIVLDLGCGPGFWSVELQLQCKIEKLFSADLTAAAVDLTKRRLALYGLPNDNVRQENAEALTFADATFGHVNCQGVVHHTPDTAGAIGEIARVLRPGGTASISVYYRNIVLRHFVIVRWFAKFLRAIGATLKGRGREGIFGTNDADEIVRLYDGSENPIGICFDRRQFVELLSRHFVVEKIYFHNFPARTLPFRIPCALHRMLDRHILPFMIYANVRKR